MFENKCLLSNRGFGWGKKKDNPFLISVKHQSNGLGRRAVKQSEFCSCVQHVTVSRILKQNHTKLMDL